jgi:hypothetical protein
MAKARHLLQVAERAPLRQSGALEDSLDLEGLTNPLDREIRGGATDDGNAIRYTWQEEQACVGHRLDRDFGANAIALGGGRGEALVLHIYW